MLSYLLIGAFGKILQLKPQNIFPNFGKDELSRRNLAESS
jgi:hypothetical protein